MKWLSRHRESPFRCTSCAGSAWRSGRSATWTGPRGSGQVIHVRLGLANALVGFVPDVLGTNCPRPRLHRHAAPGVAGGADPRYGRPVRGARSGDAGRRGGERPLPRGVKVQVGPRPCRPRPRGSGSRCGRAWRGGEPCPPRLGNQRTIRRPSFAGGLGNSDSGIVATSSVPVSHFLREGY